MTKKMTLSEELEWRGFVNQTTFKTISDIDKETRTFYWGCDPSSDSLTVGNLAAGMMARLFIQYGYTPIILIGGATGIIGDPKDDEERASKSLEEIETNKKSIISQYKHIFSGKDFQLVDNYDWFKDMGYLEFLRTVGKHTSMSQMLDREFVKARVGKDKIGLSYAEFSYSLIQGYDYLHLFREHNVTLQLCGADQWGNSVAGVDLIRRLDQGEAHVWSSPLVVNKSTGKKFGKSEEGAIWLDPKKTSPYQYYQFWLNVDDAGVGEYIKIYTLIQPEAFEQLMSEFEKNPQERSAQKYLAYEATKLIHGEETAESVKRVSEVLFGHKAFSELSEDDIKALANEIPGSSEKTIITALVISGVASSNSEAHRLVDNGAISVNGEKISEDQKLTSPSLLKKGKNTFVLVR